MKEAKSDLWVTVKRCYVANEDTKLHAAWRCDDAARFWKITTPGSYAGERMIIFDVQFIAEDVGSRKKCRNTVVLFLFLRSVVPFF